MIGTNSYVSKTENEMEIHKLDDEWVVIDKKQEKVSVMNGTAFLVWKSVQKGTPIEVRELCCNISGGFPEVDKSQIEQDILEIVNLMIQEQLLYEL